MNTQTIKTQKAGRIGETAVAPSRSINRQREQTVLSKEARRIRNLAISRDYLKGYKWKHLVTIYQLSHTTIRAILKARGIGPNRNDYPVRTR